MPWGRARDAIRSRSPADGCTQTYRPPPAAAYAPLFLQYVNDDLFNLEVSNHTKDRILLFVRLRARNLPTRTGVAIVYEQEYDVIKKLQLKG